MFNKILYPVDLVHEGLARKLAVQVQALARDFDAELELMTAMPGFGMAIVASYFPPDAEARARAEVESRLQAFSEQAFGRVLPLSVAQGTHWRRVVETAKQREIDLIVMPFRSKAWKDGHMPGSCSSKVVEQAPCSVLLLKP